MSACPDIWAQYVAQRWSWIILQEQSVGYQLGSAMPCLLILVMAAVAKNNPSRLDKYLNLPAPFFWELLVSDRFTAACHPQKFTGVLIDPVAGPLPQKCYFNIPRKDCFLTKIYKSANLANQKLLAVAKSSLAKQKLSAMGPRCSRFSPEPQALLNNLMFVKDIWGVIGANGNWLIITQKMAMKC